MARYFSRSSTVIYMAQTVKNLPAMQLTWIRSLGLEDHLEKEMATHSSILVWRIPWTEEPGGLQSMGPQGIRHNWSDLAHTHTPKCAEEPESLKQISPGLWPWAVLQMRFSGRRKAEQMDGLLTGSKNFLKPRKQGNCCYSAPTEDCAQLRDFKPNCHQDRLSDCGDFLLILS